MTYKPRTIIKQNYQFTINNNFSSATQLADALRKVASLVEDGYTSGYEPYWTVLYSEKDVTDLIDELAKKAIELNPDDPHSETMNLVCSSELGDGEADDDEMYDSLVCDRVQKLLKPAGVPEGERN